MSATDTVSDTNKQTCREEVPLTDKPPSVCFIDLKDNSPPDNEQTLYDVFDISTTFGERGRLPEIILNTLNEF